jgi:hypothetical protein
MQTACTKTFVEVNTKVFVLFELELLTARRSSSRSRGHYGSLQALVQAIVEDETVGADAIAEVFRSGRVTARLDEQRPGHRLRLRGCQSPEA